MEHLTPGISQNRQSLERKVSNWSGLWKRYNDNLKTWIWWNKRSCDTADAQSNEKRLHSWHCFWLMRLWNQKIFLCQETLSDLLQSPAPALAIEADSWNQSGRKSKEPDPPQSWFRWTLVMVTFTKLQWTIKAGEWSHQRQQSFIRRKTKKTCRGPMWALPFFCSVNSWSMLTDLQKNQNDLCWKAPWVNRSGWCETWSGAFIELPKVVPRY